MICVTSLLAGGRRDTGLRATERLKDGGWRGEEVCEIGQEHKLHSLF
jgi:hypothetical protein